MSWDDPARTGDEPDAGTKARRPRDEPRFDEHDVLGSGASGRIVRAVDRRLERDVALKIVTPDRPQALARLRREAAVLAALEHPGIVPIYDLLERDDGGLQLALRIVRGRTLDRAMADAPRDPRWLGHLLRASEAIAFAHARGIVHRDIKPANIMIGEHGETQVIDWGLATAVDGDSVRDHEVDGCDSGETPPNEPRLTRAGAIVGTPAYMAPEQARGARADRRSDVWSLGAILFEIVSGRALVADHAAIDGSAASVLTALREGRVPDAELLARCRARLPADLGALLGPSLALDPEQRPLDAAAFARALAAVRPRARARSAALVGLIAILGGVATAFAMTRSEPANDPPEHAAAPPEVAPRADDPSVRSLSGDPDAALRALVEGREPEAAALAAEVLAYGASPDASGVLAAIDLAHAPRLVAASQVASCGAPALASDGRHWLCREPERVRVYEGARLLWQRDGATAGAVFIAGGARVLVGTAAPGGTVVRRHDSDSGAAGAPFDTGCAGTLSATAAGDRAFLFRSDCLVVISDEHSHRLASPMALQAATVGSDGWAGLVGGGALAVGLYDEEADDGLALDVIVASRIVAERDVATMVALPGRRVALGTVGGEVLIVGLDGVVVARRRFASAGMVRAIAVAPSGRTLALSLEGHGPIVVDAALRIIARLPLRDAGALVVADDGVTTLAARLARWTLDPAARPELPSFPGLAALATDGVHLALAHGTTLAWLDLADGATQTLPTEAPLVDVVIAPGPVVTAVDAVSPRLTRMGVDPLRAFPGGAQLPAGARALGVTAAGTLVVATYSHELYAEPPGSGEAQPVLAAWVEDLAVRGAAIGALDGDTHDLVLLVADPVPSERQRCHDPEAIALAVAADASIIYGLHRDAIVGYDATSCAITAWLPDDSGALGDLATLDVSWDGAWIAAGARDGRLLVWRRDGELAARLRFAGERVAALAFDPDGRFLVTGTVAGSVRLLDLSTLDRAPSTLMDAARAAWGP